MEWKPLISDVARGESVAAAVSTLITHLAAELRGVAGDPHQIVSLANQLELNRLPLGAACASCAPITSHDVDAGRIVELEGELADAEREIRSLRQVADAGSRTGPSADPSGEPAAATLEDENDLHGHDLTEEPARL